MREIACPLALVVSLALVQFACEASGSGEEVAGGGAGGAVDDAGREGSTYDASACKTADYELVRTPTNLFLMVDRSSSMWSIACGGESRWKAISDAVVQFMQASDSQNAGLGVGFFPMADAALTPCATVADCTDTQECVSGVAHDFPICMDKCSIPAGCGSTHQCADLDGSSVCSSSRCDSAAYSVAAVDIGPMSDEAHRNAVFTGFQQYGPLTLTPTLPALGGAVEYATAWMLKTTPGQRVAVVLVTDGPPTECFPQNGATAAAAIGASAEVAGKAAAALPPVETFVVALTSGGEDTTQLVQIAQAGGTGMAHEVQADPQLPVALADVLGEVLTAAGRSCDYVIPDDALPWAPGRINVTIGSADAEPLPYVAGPAGCSGAKPGWHYDVDPEKGKPHRILLCGASCEVVALSTGGVGLQTGCETVGGTSGAP